MAKKTQSYYIEDEVIKELKARAKANGLSTSDYLNTLLYTVFGLTYNPMEQKKSKI